MVLDVVLLVQRLGSHGEGQVGVGRVEVEDAAMTSLHFARGCPPSSHLGLGGCFDFMLLLWRIL